MAEAKNGDTVRVHYTGTLEDGTVFDSSAERDPLEFKLGEGQVIPGFEEAVLGMSVGDKRCAHIAAENAYGPFDQGMVQEIDRAHIPAEIQLEIGRQLMVPQPGGEPIILSIIDFNDQSVTVDANHPLAGHNLHFDIELMEIV